MRLIFTFLLALSLLTGCASILPKGPPAAKLYTLNPPQVTQSAKRLPVSLQVLMPQAAPGLETERIALRKDDNQIDYYADVRWASSLNAMVQSLLVESFENSHSLKAVGNDLVEMSPSHSLLIEIRDFQIEGSQAHVRLTAKLMKADKQEIILTRSYDEKAAVDSNDMTHIMKAFDNAYQEAARKLVADMLAQFGRK